MGVGCGLLAWIDEAEQREGGSPVRRRRCKSEGFNLERKAETRKMWLLVRGRGGEVDISAEAKNLESLQRKNWRTKCHQNGPLFRIVYDM